MNLHAGKQLAGALALAAASAGLPAQAALLYEQVPSLGANAVANGTDGQAPRLAETFTFSGTAHTLAWWGTAAEGFDVSLHDGLGLGAALANFGSVQSTSTGLSIAIDGVGTEVFRYSIDVGSLAGGQYTLSVSEIASDALGLTWYWLQGQTGDGSSITDFGDRARGLNPFDLSIQVLGDTPRGLPAPPTGWLLLAAGTAGWRFTRRGRGGSADSAPQGSQGAVA